MSAHHSGKDLCILTQAKLPVCLGSNYSGAFWDHSTYSWVYWSRPCSISINWNFSDVGGTTCLSVSFYFSYLIISSNKRLVWTFVLSSPVHLTLEPIYLHFNRKFNLLYIVALTLKFSQSQIIFLSSTYLLCKRIQISIEVLPFISCLRFSWNSKLFLVVD